MDLMPLLLLILSFQALPPNAPDVPQAPWEPVGDKVIADFNGDGKDDWAQLHKDVEGDAFALFAKLDGEYGYHGLARAPLVDLDRVVLSAAAPGTYEAPCARGIGGDCGPGRPAEMNIDRTGIAYIFPEASARVFFWTESGFEEFWLSD